ncbi:hypothetical protein Q3G72_015620 [Acer saccharum]|nr:hypothetical protein Q3G72_015620 [Acer saccharum]
MKGSLELAVGAASSIFCLLSSKLGSSFKDCEYKFMCKYVKVGSIKKEEVPVVDSESAAEEKRRKVQLFSLRKPNLG